MFGSDLKMVKMCSLDNTRIDFWMIENIKVAQNKEKMFKSDGTINV